MSVPEPKTFNGAPGEVAGDDQRATHHTTSYACLDCAWTGRGVAAYDHHQIDHHRIVLRLLGDQIAFSCCPKGVPEPLAEPSAMDQVRR